jgi:prenyltransferase beta subunit
LSIRLEMLQVARLAPQVLGDDAAAAVAGFYRSQFVPLPGAGGGFADRAGASDLYYTVFGVEGLIALRQKLRDDQLRDYLQSFGDGGELDFVHLTALCRCWADLKHEGLLPGVKQAMLDRLASLRSTDGGYALTPGEATGSAYATFLTFGAYQDLDTPMPDVHRLPAFIATLANDDGGYRNDPSIPAATTPTTAAAVTVLRQLHAPPHAKAGEYLLSQFHPQGGFLALPGAPMPDLLSTATALHALAGLQIDCPGVKEPCLDFIDSLWTNQGAFHGNWSDEAIDVEYTYYALLALGHLSVI